MLNECLPICPVDSFDELIFLIVLPSARQLLSKGIDEICENLTNALENKDQIGNKLQTCRSILDCWQKSFQAVKKQDKVPILRVQTLLFSFFEATECIFNHCKKSESIYGAFMGKFGEELKSLYAKCKESLLIFVHLLSNVVSCDSKSTEETDILIRVIDKIADLASLSNGIDYHAMAFLWKIFARLGIQYESVIKGKSAEKVTGRFRTIAKDMTDLLQTLLQDRQLKIKEKNTTYAGGLLKILEKLFEAYGNCVNNETLLSFVELLVQLNCYSPARLESLQIDKSVIKSMELHVFVNFEHFLNTHIQNGSFVEVFHEYETKDEKDALGYHLLIICVLKYLAKSSYDSQRLWILRERSILDRLLSNSDTLCVEFCAAKMKIPNAHDLGENPQLLSLYEATLVSICNVLYQVPAADFNAVEKLLLKYVLGGQMWSSQLSSDVWCFLSRFGSQQLRYDHTKFLIKLYSRLTRRETSLEVIVLSNLIARLYSKLSENCKDSIVMDLEDLALDAWKPLGKVLSEGAKSKLRKRALEHGDLETSFTALWEKPSVESWQRFIKLLNFYESAHVILDPKMAKTVAKVWECVAKTDDCDDFLLSELAGTLFGVTRLEEKDNNLLEPMLESMITLSSFAPPHLRIRTVHFLKDNVKTFAIFKPALGDCLAKLFCCLLGDKDPLVLQEAFECFNYFVNVCSNELLLHIMNVVKKDEKITKAFRCFAMHDSSSYVSHFESSEEFLRCLLKDPKDIVHKCCEKDDEERAEKRPRLEIAERHSSMVTMAEMDKQINNVLKGMEHLLPFKDMLSEETKNKLRTSFSKLCP